MKITIVIMLFSIISFACHRPSPYLDISLEVKQERYHRALEMIEKVEKWQNINKYELFYIKGIVLFKLNQFENAINVLEEVIMRNKNDEKVKLLLLDCYSEYAEDLWSKKKFEVSIIYYKKYVQLSSNILYNNK